MEILRKKGEMSKGKLILARERVTENEMKDCTFEPETNVKESSSEGSIRAGQRMYNRHMEKLKEKRGAPAMNSEDIEVSLHCTFEPEIIQETYRSRQESARTRRALAAGGSPNAFPSDVSSEKSTNFPRSYEKRQF